MRRDQSVDNSGPMRIGSSNRLCSAFQFA
jgi:hypothetical protein